MIEPLDKGDVGEFNSEVQRSTERVLGMSSIMLMTMQRYEWRQYGW